MTISAADLHETLRPIMGRGILPEWLRLSPFEEWYDDRTDAGGGVATDAAELIAEGAMVRWLIGEGWHRFTWEYNSDADLVTLHLYGNRHTGKTHIAALVAACVAVLEETK